MWFKAFDCGVGSQYLTGRAFILSADTVEIRVPGSGACTFVTNAQGKVLRSAGSPSP